MRPPEHERQSPPPLPLEPFDLLCPCDAHGESLVAARRPSARTSLATAALSITDPNVERPEAVIDSLQELGLLRARRHGHAHASLCQANVRDDSIRIVVEVQEVVPVELELRRPDLGERRMGAKRSQERGDPVERRLFHS
jgi:hypothetical protein